MKIEKGLWVELEYTVTIDTGEVVDQTPPGETRGFVVGAGHILEAFERRLVGLEKGQSASITLEPEEAYGASTDYMTNEVPRSHFPEEMDLKPGMALGANGPQGPVTFRVLAVREDTVVIDLNHPLADKKISFQVKIHDVRQPSEQEYMALARQQMAAEGGDPDAPPQQQGGGSPWLPDDAIPAGPGRPDDARMPPGAGGPEGGNKGPASGGGGPGGAVGSGGLKIN